LLFIFKVLVHHKILGSGSGVDEDSSVLTFGSMLIGK
jgi:hypothetical protein